MFDGKIEASKEGAVGWLVFSSPQRLNAVSYEMWQSIPEKIAFLVNDAGVRVIILRGEGDEASISGADISQFERVRSSEAGIADYDSATRRANEAILGCAKPTIAMIHGYCIGGGLGVALCCDLRLASTNARFAIPAARLGLGYGYGGIKRLVDVVGPSFAKEIFYTARQFNSDEAIAMGLINRVFSPANLLAAVNDAARRIGQNAPLTISAAKLAIELAEGDWDGKDSSVVDNAVARCFASEDYKEGRRAFAEKRIPKFKGL
jgi:enoyl-CoA hydratase/carnithine racemase